MIGFPHAKVNLGLQVLSKRTDGYHEIATCFYPVPVTDALEIIPSNSFRFTSSGLDIPGDPAGNLCCRAYELLREAFDIPSVHIHLHKVIPMGAGLGGGSSDGAFTLRLLSSLFSLDTEGLPLLAAQLGSDCPFFLQDQPMLASGTGTTLTPSGLSLKGNHVLIIYPAIHVSTAAAYAGVTPSRPANTLNEILSDRLQWKSHLVNDFEKPVTEKHPEIGQVINRLYDNGSWYAAMSGSGSAVFGLFETTPPEIPWPAEYSVFRSELP